MEFSADKPLKGIAIIPARGGSKGVPGKNIVDVAGKPLISYTIETALQCPEIDRVCVSSDDKGILDLCREYDGVKLHTRSKDIAKDNSPVSDTIRVVLDEDKEDYDLVMLLQPTSPIRKPENLSEAVQSIIDNPTVNSVISVCEMNDLHPARMYWKESEKLIPVIPEFEQIRRQDIPPAYYRNGCIYLVRTSSFNESGIIMAKPIKPYVMPSSWLLNIDEPRDLLVAELLIKEWQKGNL